MKNFRVEFSLPDYFYLGDCWNCPLGHQGDFRDEDGDYDCWVNCGHPDARENYCPLVEMHYNWGK